MAPAKRKSFSVKCFGTGDGWPSADRNHAAFLYRFGKNAILVDCGEPIDRNYKASGLSYDAFDSILISHMHSDHVGGFFMLMQGAWLEGRRKALPVYLPSAAIPPVRQMLETVFIFDEILPFQLRLLPLHSSQSVEIGEVTATAFRTSHLAGYRSRLRRKYRSDFNSYCFLFECGRRRLGHSADLGRPEDLEPLLAGPLDLLVCELAHFSPEEIFRYLNGRDIKRIVFVHLAQSLQEDLAKTRRLAERMLSGIPHMFARDGEEIGF
jgi:ribonuclease BN (tRNA processing enzyme)